MVLYIVGLGLGDEKDITLRGLEAVKSCTRVYLEMYTSILPGVDKSKQEELYGKEVIVADREMVEQKADEIMEGAATDNIAFLVVGDPFGATTHTDFEIRAREKGIEVQVIHNASIMNAIGCCGLQLYRYGETVSMVFFTDTWRPDSFYDKIAVNRKMGLHTLVLLDIRVKEPTVRALCKGIKEYEPPRFMSVATCAEQLLEVEENRGEGAYTPETLCVGLARVGAADQKIVAGTLLQMKDADLGPPLHSFIIAGNTHPIEEEMLSGFRLPA